MHGKIQVQFHLSKISNLFEKIGVNNFQRLLIRFNSTLNNHQQIFTSIQHKTSESFTAFSIPPTSKVTNQVHGFFF